MQRKYNEKDRLSESLVEINNLNKTTALRPQRSCICFSLKIISSFSNFSHFFQMLLVCASVPICKHTVCSSTRIAGSHHPVQLYDCVRQIVHMCYHDITPAH